MGRTLFRLSSFLARTMLSRVDFWSWAVAFMVFWSAMGAYVFSRGITEEELLARGVPKAAVEEVLKEVAKRFASGWYASITVLSLSVISSVLVEHFYLSVAPLRYLSRFTRASAPVLLAGFLLGSLAVMAATFSLLVAVMMAMFGDRFGFLIAPRNPVGMAAASVKPAACLELLAMSLGLLVVVIRRPRSLPFVANAVTAVAFGCTPAHIYVGGVGFHLLPFNSAMALMYYYSSGYEAPLSGPLARGPAGETVDPAFSWAVLLAWTAALAISSLTLLKRQAGVGAEELREL